MRLLMVGGSGRSGTSAIAERLRVVPEIHSFLDVELRIFSEADGIVDLYWNLVEAYSPQRSVVALDRFSIMFEALLEDAPGAVGLSQYIDSQKWGYMLSAFKSKLVAVGRVPRKLESTEFFKIAAELVNDIASLDQSAGVGPQANAIFLEKTPHNILRLRLLSRMPLRSYYLHVIRDPRTVAKSLHKMPWGPPSLQECSEWVAQYFSEYFRTFEWAQRANIKIRNIHIESVSKAPRQIAGQIFEDLGIVGIDSIFDDIGASELDKTNAEIAPDELIELNRSLAGLAARLGYCIEAIGELTYDPFPNSSGSVLT